MEIQDIINRFLGYNSDNCPPACGKASNIWHFNFNNPASKTANKPVLRQ
jgi:hypothetical protein